MATVILPRTPLDVAEPTIVEPVTSPTEETTVFVDAAEQLTWDEGVANIPFVKIYVSSIAFVALAFLLGVGVPTSMYLDDWVGGMGLGGMCALWGGPSFGVMTGSARVSAHMERFEH